MCHWHTSRDGWWPQDKGHIGEVQQGDESRNMIPSAEQWDFKVLQRAKYAGGKRFATNRRDENPGARSKVAQWHQPQCYALCCSTI